MSPFVRAIREMGHAISARALGPRILVSGLANETGVAGVVGRRSEQVDVGGELVGIYFSVSPHYDRTIFHMQSDLFQNALHAAIVA